MRLEDLLNDSKKETQKELIKNWEDSGLLEGLSSSQPNNMAVLLEAKQKQKIEDVKYPTDDNIESFLETVLEVIEDGQEINEFVIPEYLINDPEVVGYPDLEMQKVIYDWVLEDLPVAGYTVKDLGAGRGDFYGHLRNPKGHLINYTGIESKESLVQVGRKKHEGVNLMQGDFFNTYIETDYTICIGTLNEDHGYDKWEYFNKTLNYCLESTKVAIIFVLAADMDGIPGFLDYPLNEILSHIPKELRFNIDYTRFQDIYKLTVHIGGYND